MSGSEIRSYKDLDVWRLAMKLAAACYSATAKFPREEIYGITSQIRRAAVSIPANIAEGYGRESTGDYVRFLRIAQGSLKELETLAMLAQEIGYLTEAGASELLGECERVSKMLPDLIRALERKQ